MRGLLKDKLETDMEKKSGPAGQAQRQARNTKRMKRRAKRRINKIRKLQKERVKENKTSAVWNVQMANIHRGRFEEIVKLCKRSGMDITFVAELNTFCHGINKFEIDGGGGRRELEQVMQGGSVKQIVLMEGVGY